MFIGSYYCKYVINFKLYKKFSVLSMHFFGKHNSVHLHISLVFFPSGFSLSLICCLVSDPTSVSSNFIQTRFASSLPPTIPCLFAWILQLHRRLIQLWLKYSIFNRSTHNHFLCTMEEFWIFYMQMTTFIYLHTTPGITWNWYT